jgi:hypothetical protein
MRIAIMTGIAPLLLITGATLSTPAAATDAKQAISMCDARGDACRMHVGDNGDVTITVQNSGGTGTIWCPQSGSCAVVVGARKGGKGGVGTVTGVLRVPLGGVALQPGTSSPSKPTTVRDSGGIKTTSVGLKEAGGGNQPVIKQAGGPQHSNGKH